MLRNLLLSALVALCPLAVNAQISDQGDGTFTNPVIYADVPDLDIIRVDDTYYMVSTTMHMSPGCTIMKSHDLVNWQVAGYAHDQLGEEDRFALKNGQSEYATGSWAANLRYDPYEKLYYVLVTCNSTQQSYIFSTHSIEEGHWHREVVDMCYDPGFLFEDTGTEMKKYIFHPDYSLQKNMIYMRTMETDGEGGVKLSEPKIIIEHGNIERPAEGLRAEGAHGYKVGDYYYLFMIQGKNIPGSWRRQEIVWRSKTLEPGSWELRKVMDGNIYKADGTEFLPFTGVAQGGIVDTPDGRWYSFLFQDCGAVGRMPVLMPMSWTMDKWPVLGNGGFSANYQYEKPLQGQPRRGIVENDEFDNQPKRYVVSEKYASNKITAGITQKQLSALEGKGRLTAELVAQNEYNYNGSNLKLCWQWNHNPNNNLWSLTERRGWLRLKSGILAHTIRDARNTLTQRTYGPTSHAETVLDVSLMRDGDVAGLSSYQNQYGFVGVRQEGKQRFIVMHRATKRDDAEGQEIARVPMKGKKVWLKVMCDFTDRKDEATFAYSLDGQNWMPLGDTLHMAFDWPDFVGQRYGLFYYATKKLGGAADFDYFHVGD